MKTTFTKEEDDYIRENYLKAPSIKQLARDIGRSSCGVLGRMKVMKLVVPKELAAARMKASHYKKGSVPATKGKKQAEYMTAAGIERAKKTRFKKGRVPHNTLEDGTEVKRLDNNGIPYLYIKVPGITKAVLKHKYNWEKVHGPIPSQCIISFKDGNTQNCNVDNLECISRGEHLRRNRYNTVKEWCPEQAKRAIINQIKNNNNAINRIKQGAV